MRILLVLHILRVYDKYTGSAVLSFTDLPTLILQKYYLDSPLCYMIYCRYKYLIYLNLQCNIIE